MKIKALALVTVFASFFFNSVNAQEAAHVVKINLASLAFRNISLQYEKPFHDKMSVSLGVRFQMPRNLPDLTGGTADGTGNIESSLYGYAITPEFRFYTGDKGAPKGFYFAPYFRYTSFTVKTVSEYTDDQQVVQEYGLTGKFTGIGGGLMIGAQWLINDKFSIDWWILGGHYGTATASLRGENKEGTWSQSDQDAIEAELKSQEVPFGSTSYSVTEKEARLNWNMPFLGLRPGLCIGYAF